MSGPFYANIDLVNLLADEPEVIKKIFIDYIAADGGGKLEPGDEIASLKPGVAAPFTTRNQNGILFLLCLVASWSKSEIAQVGYASYRKVFDLFNRAFDVHRFQTCVEPGLFARRFGDTLDQSHDNIMAWLLGSLFFQSNNAISRDILRQGERNFWNYNINEPEKIKGNCFLLGMDVACVYLSNGLIPNLLWSAWLILSLVTYRSSDPGLVSFIRCEIVKHSWLRFSDNFKGSQRIKFILWAVNFHEKRRGPMREKFRQYCVADPSHPLTSL